MTAVEEAGDGKVARRGRGRPPNPALRAAKHSRMLSAAIELFIEHGYEHVTVEQISQVAGQSKGAFYWYFQDKEDCLNQIIHGFMQKVEETVGREVGAAQNSREKLLNLTDYRNWNLGEFGKSTLLVDSMLFSRSPSVRRLGVKTASRIYESLFAKLIEVGKAAALEAGWTSAQMESFDFQGWAWCCLTCFAGTLEFLNQEYLAFAPGDERLANAIHRCFASPVVGARQEPLREQATG